MSYYRPSGPLYLYALMPVLMVTVALAQSSAEQTANLKAKCGFPSEIGSITYHLDRYASGGKQVRVERYEPEANGKYPAVILIHGSAGLFTLEGIKFPHRQNFGERELSCAGFVALVIHYFDVSGILSTGDVEFMKNQSTVWLQTLSDAISYAQKLKKVDKKKIGLLGESLGGYLALALAAKDHRIGAVSEDYAGMPDEWMARAKKLPPVLIQHGDADTVVPVKEAYKLERWLYKRHLTHVMYIYPGLNHNLNAKGRMQALERSIAFFDRYLKSVAAVKSEN